MKVIVNGRNIELTPAIKEHIEEKLSKLNTHYDFVQEAHVFLSVEKNPSIKDSHCAEATLHCQGSIVRVSVASADLYASIDDLVKKLERGLRKHKTKLIQRSQGRHHAASIRKPEEDTGADGALDEDDDEDFVVFDSEPVPSTQQEEKEAPALT